ncbi:unnamed protein product, partial [Closterium sp. Naga37s-1]
MSSHKHDTSSAHGMSPHTPAVLAFGPITSRHMSPVTPQSMCVSSPATTLQHMPTVPAHHHSTPSAPRFTTPIDGSRPTHARHAAASPEQQSVRRAGTPQKHGVTSVTAQQQATPAVGFQRATPATPTPYRPFPPNVPPASSLEAAPVPAGSAAASSVCGSYASGGYAGGSRGSLGARGACTDASAAGTSLEAQGVWGLRRHQGSDLGPGCRLFETPEKEPGGSRVRSASGAEGCAGEVWPCSSSRCGPTTPGARRAGKRQGHFEALFTTTPSCQSFPPAADLDHGKLNPASAPRGCAAISRHLKPPSTFLSDLSPLLPPSRPSPPFAPSPRHQTSTMTSTMVARILHLLHVGVLLSACAFEIRILSSPPSPPFSSPPHTPPPPDLDHGRSHSASAARGFGRTADFLVFGHKQQRRAITEAVRLALGDGGEDGGMGEKGEEREGESSRGEGIVGKQRREDRQVGRDCNGRAYGAAAGAGTAGAGTAGAGTAGAGTAGAGGSSRWAEKGNKENEEGTGGGKMGESVEERVGREVEELKRSRAAAAKWVKFVVRAKAAGQTAESFEARGNQEAARVLRAYASVLEKCNAVDYHDFILLSTMLLTQHSDVLEECASAWTHVLVDEFQDTSRIQFAFVKALCHSHGRITVVGDDDQSIFSFNGANAASFDMFREQFPDHTEVRLCRNYRSTGTIVRASAAVISQNFPGRRAAKELCTDNGDGEKIRVVEVRNEAAQCALVIIPPFSTHPYPSVHGRVVEVRNEAAQCALVADAIMSFMHQMHRVQPHTTTATTTTTTGVTTNTSATGSSSAAGNAAAGSMAAGGSAAGNTAGASAAGSAAAAGVPLAWSDVAVLYRRQVTGRPFQAAMRERKIPFNVHGVAFYRKKALRNVLALLRLSLPALIDNTAARRVWKLLFSREKDEAKKAADHVEQRARDRGCSFLEAAETIFSGKVSGRFTRKQLKAGASVLTTVRIARNLLKTEMFQQQYSEKAMNKSAATPKQ